MANAKKNTATPAANIWAQGSSSNESDRPEITTYLNVELEVAEGIHIRMPLNCPVSLDIKGMGANQRKLMEVLLAKAANAKSDEDLIIQCPVKLSLFVKGSNEADDSGWSL
ncbi:MAG: hypothetical protein ACRCVV_21955 [Shewanella sp.]